MTAKSVPISSSRSYSSRGIIAVARSSVFSAWRLQKAGWAMRQRCRSATDMPSASRVVCIAARNPSAALSPPTFRIRSLKTGSNSTQ